MRLALLLLLCWLSWAQADPRQLAWRELVPADAPRFNPGSIDHGLGEDGPAASQPWPDAPTVAALDGQEVRLPGYVVPLMVTEEGEVTEFLLVPYYGACIHVPPPPGNQIVYVKGSHDLWLSKLHLPYWVEGRLGVGIQRSEVAVAGYWLQAQRVLPYILKGDGS